MRVVGVVCLLAACNVVDPPSGHGRPPPPPPTLGGSSGSESPPDPTDTGGGHTGTTEPRGGFCDTRRVFDRSCVMCHRDVEPQGGLDLVTDPWAALVGVTSEAYGAPLVVPGDPGGSLLWRKMDGSQGSDQGAAMPPTGHLDAATESVRRWIAEGATDACDAPDPTEPEPYHPEGWAAPAVHGLAAKLQTEADCRTCHGADLSGGSSQVACGSCHAAGWATTCTYCHGGVESATGAPPEDIDDGVDPATISFPPHGVHVAGRITAAFDCVVCHAKPTDALTPGHLFDDATPGAAEVSLADGSYDPTTATCSDRSCHGDGRGGTGVLTSHDGPRTCGSCHPDGTDPARWDAMSGHHEKHLRHAFLCGDCHPDALGSDAIDEPALHVNGAADVLLPQGMAFDPATETCEGTCHGERHRGRSW